MSWTSLKTVMYCDDKKNKDLMKNLYMNLEIILII